MFQIVLRSVWAGRRRWVGLLVAVAVSVAFVTATLTIKNLVASTLEAPLDARLAGVDAVVRSATGQSISQDSAIRAWVDGAVLEAVARSPQATKVEGLIEGGATIIGPDRRPLPEIFGSGTSALNWLSDDQLRGVRIVDGSAPRRQGDAVVDVGTARDGRLSVGDRVTVDFPTASRTLNIVGIAGVTRGGEVVATNRFVAMTEATTRAVLDKPDGFDMVLARSSSGGGKLAGALNATLPEGIEARTGSSVIAEQQRSVRRVAELFTKPVSASGFIAMFVGAFVIFNTFSIVVAQRTRELALLRAVGATRRQVTRSVLVEATVVGVIGVTTGWALALATRSLFASLMSLPNGPMRFSVATVIIGFVTGVSATVAASAIPALKAGSVPPIAAMRGAHIDDSHRSKGRHRLGDVLLVAGAALIGIILSGTAKLGMAGIGAGSAAVFISFAVGGPAVIGPVFGMLGRPAIRARGVTARLGVRNAVRNPERTSVVIAALSVGVALVTVITTFETSIRAATESRATNQLAGIDLVVESPVGIAPTVVDKIRTVPGVQIATPVKHNLMTVLNSVDARKAQQASAAAETPVAGGAPVGDPKFMLGVDLATAMRMVKLDGLNPPISDLADNEILVLEKSAEYNGWKPGDTVDAWFATTGNVELRIAATFQSRVGIDVEYVANLHTTAVNAPPEFTADYAIWAKFDPAANQPRTLSTIRKELARTAPAATVATLDEYVTRRLGGLSSLMNLLVVLVAVSVIVAWIGVANAVSLALRERQPEITRLRALGVTRNQIHESIAWETLLTSVCGSTLGIITGWIMAAGFVVALKEEGLTPVINPATAIVIACAGAAAGITAAIRPAISSSKATLP